MISEKSNMKFKTILPIIVIAQFFCCSSWFAVNAVIGDIITHFKTSQHFLANATIAIQFGFIIGTLAFATFNITDRFSPSKVFFVSSLFVCVINLAIIFPGIQETQILSSRFLLGFFLAGIYPVGMKITADYFENSLGLSLSFLVGALVLGTAFPHFIKSFSWNISYQYVIYGTSLLTFIGGLSIFIFVPDGPFRKRSQKLEIRALFDGFKDNNFKSAAFAYFGHMWELYTFWAFVPIMIQTHISINNLNGLNVSLLSFFIIASGSVACVASGFFSQKFGVKKIAIFSLSLSMFCCLLSPILLFVSSTFWFMSYLLFWGMVVVADSPLFSTLVARFAPAATKGTALTLVNCLGFSITILSIKFLNISSGLLDNHFIYVLLAIGPILGLWSLLNPDN
jgi:MFS family permease